MISQFVLSPCDFQPKHRHRHQQLCFHTPACKMNQAALTTQREQLRGVRGDTSRGTGDWSNGRYHLQNMRCNQKLPAAVGALAGGVGATIRASTDTRINGGAGQECPEIENTPSREVVSVIGGGRVDLRRALGQFDEEVDVMFATLQFALVRFKCSCVKIALNALLLLTISKCSKIKLSLASSDQCI